MTVDALATRIEFVAEIKRLLCTKDDSNVSVENEKTSIVFMMDYVEKYLNGKSQRFSFDLNFKFHLLRLWDEMCEEDMEWAQAIKHYIGDNGFEAGEELADSKYKELIRQQYHKVEKLVGKSIK